MNPPRQTVVDTPGARRPFIDTLGPVALALFAFAGQIKLSPLLSWVPQDLTLLLGLAVTVAVIASRTRSGPTSGALAIPITLLGILQLGLVHSSFQDYARTKVVTLWTFTALSMLAPFYLLRAEWQRRLFLGTLVVLASAIAIVTYIRPASVDTYTNTAVFEGTNTIETARMTDTGVVICLILIIVARMPVWKRVILAVTSIILMIVALGAGSRGPFLAIVAGVFTALITSPVFRKVRGRAILAAVILGSATVTWASNSNSDGVIRVLDFLSGQQNNSSLTREFFWLKSLDYIGSSPQGIGWGNFVKLPGMAIYGNAQGAQYPHNLILETFVEGGWLVGFAVLLYLVASIVRAGLFSVSPVSAAIYGLLVFSTFNAMVSGDINDSRLLWILLSCSWLVRKPPVARPEPMGVEYSAKAGLASGD